jgi:hypothetical protein
MNETVKNLLQPLRLMLGRVVLTPDRLRTINPINTMTLMEKVAWFVAAEKVEGDYLEFGVFRGDGFARSFHALRAAFEERIRPAREAPGDAEAEERRAIWDRMRFFAFDSFQGLPELEGIDQVSQDFRKGQYAAGVETFRGNIAAQGVPLDRVTCVPGWYEDTCNPETLARHRIEKAAIVYVDCDLYHSTRSVLSCLAPVLQDGTVIVFDDWFCYRGNPDLGEQRAFNEWRATLPDFRMTEYHREGYARNSFIASRIGVS